MYLTVFSAAPKCEFPDVILKGGKIKCLRGTQMSSKCRFICDEGKTLVGGEWKNKCLCQNPWTCDWEYDPKNYLCV